MLEMIKKFSLTQPISCSCQIKLKLKFIIIYNNCKIKLELIMYHDLYKPISMNMKGLKKYK